MSASARCARLAGRSLERRSNASPRGMIVLDRIRLTGPPAAVPKTPRHGAPYTIQLGWLAGCVPSRDVECSLRLGDVEACGGAGLEIGICDAKIEAMVVVAGFGRCGRKCQGIGRGGVVHALLQHLCDVVVAVN